MNATEMWQQYGGHGTYEITSFGTGNEADRLADLIFSGKKHATTSAYYWYESGEEKMPERGDYSVVVDGQNNAVCITRTTRVYITTFKDVNAATAEKEGEGDLSLEYWRKAHQAFFTEDLKEAGRKFDPRMQVVCEEFEKVYP